MSSWWTPHPAGRQPAWLEDSVSATFFSSSDDGLTLTDRLTEPCQEIELLLSLAPEDSIPQHFDLQPKSGGKVAIKIVSQKVAVFRFVDDGVDESEDAS